MWIQRCCPSTCSVPPRRTARGGSTTLYFSSCWGFLSPLESSFLCCPCSVVELVEDGKATAVTMENRKEFFSLWLHFRLHEFDKQVFPFFVSPRPLSCLRSFVFGAAMRGVPERKMPSCVCMVHSGARCSPWHGSHPAGGDHRAVILGGASFICLWLGCFRSRPPHTDLSFSLSAPHRSCSRRCAALPFSTSIC